MLEREEGWEEEEMRDVRKSRNDQLYEELITEIKKDREEGNKVIVGGDFNEENKEGTMMNKYLEEEGLVNIIGSRIENIPPTRKPGKRAIDHIWATSGFNSRISRIGIIPRDHLFMSDHRGLLVDIGVGEELDRMP